MAQSEFDEELAQTLDAMADRFEGKPAIAKESRLGASLTDLEQTVQTHNLKLETFLMLLRRTEHLATSLNREI